MPSPVAASPPRSRPAHLFYLFALLRAHRPFSQDAVALRAARSFLAQKPSLPPPGVPPVWLEAFLALHDAVRLR